MKKRFSWFLFKIIQFFVWVFYPKVKVTGKENIPEGPVIYVGNHTQIHGPLMGHFYIPGDHYIWCIGEMMEWKEVPSYAFKDFWSFKPKYTHWFYRNLSYLITPISVILFNNAGTIPVYHDARLKTTFSQTIEKLSEGASVVIFPEKNEKYNHILYAFQEHFVDVARFYYKKYSEAVSFVPVYLAPRLKEMVIGKPIKYDPNVPIKEERARICKYLMDTITETAESLPRHIVVPYRNIPKKEYPWNNEETCC